MFNTDTKLRWDSQTIARKHKEAMHSDLVNDLPAGYVPNAAASLIAIRLFEYDVTGITLNDTYKIVNDVLGTTATWH
jgi:hypothetical protein